MLGRKTVGVADHAEQALRLGHAVDGEVGVEDLVAAVFAIGLREHHQLDIGGIAPQRLECHQQIVDFVIRQRQPKAAVGVLQRLSVLRGAARQHLDIGHGRRLLRAEQRQRLVQRGHHAFGHAVMQQRSQLLALGSAGRAAGAELVCGDPFHPPERQATVARDVAGLGRPGRHRAPTGRDDQGGDRRAGGPGRDKRLTVLQQRRQPADLRGVRWLRRRHQMAVAGTDGLQGGEHGLQAWQQLAGTGGAQRVGAVNPGDVQGSRCGRRDRRDRRERRGGRGRRGQRRASEMCLAQGTNPRGPRSTGGSAQAANSTRRPPHGVPLGEPREARTDAPIDSLPRQACHAGGQIGG